MSLLGLVYRLVEVLRAPKVPQWRQMDKFHEKFRYNILQWDDLTMEKLGVSPMECGQRNI